MSTEDQHGQMALALLYEQQPEILKKPVQAIHMAIVGGIQNKTQRLAFNAMLKHALEENEKSQGVEIESYSMSRVELMRIIDYTSPNRKYLKTVLTQMQELKVQWDILKQDGGPVWASCVLIPMIGFDKDKVFYSYAPQIKRLLLDPKIYARLDLRIQRTLKLDPASALYEWVNRFRTNPSHLTNTMTWEQWRWAIYGEVTASSILNEYKIFKRDKLKPAIAEINNKTDLKVELIEDRDGGRSVKFLQFKVEEKRVFKEEGASDGAAQAERAEWDKKLEELGIATRARAKILDRFSVESIEANYKFTMARTLDKHQRTIKNPGAYFKRALEGNYAPEPAKASPARPVDNANALGDIQSKMEHQRNREAEAMFLEMLISDRDELIREYNAEQTASLAKIPEDPVKRLVRHMVPLYAWIAKRYWGEPSVQDIFKFALESGAVTLGDVKPD